MPKTRFLNVPFIIITLSTILGISIRYFVQLNVEIVFIGFSVSMGALIFFWQRSKKMFAKSHSFTIATILFFIIFGITLVNVHNPRNNDKHYTHQINSNNGFQNIKKGIRFSVKEHLKSTSYYYKYVISIERIEDATVNGDILLQIPRDSLNNILHVGDTYTTLAKIRPISKPLNPNQFDYAKYMSNHYLYHQITISSDLLINNQQTKWSLLRIADQIRKDINLKLSNYSFTKKQLSIINALLLGQRQDISKETFKEYRDAGAIHILAVSGLHVGILLLILNLILKPIQRKGKKGKIISLFTSLLFLWCFAIIAGLSPSVLRAVTMFSFLAIGMQIGSQASIYNSLFVSMFILLCCNPLLLFSVGFQLSYIAVFSIVWIQPLIVQQYQPRFLISKKLWETFTVTMAAQLGLLPLSLFYFHQFPLLFFISNLIIIPFLGGILGFGIVVIILASSKLLPQSLAEVFGHCIDLMNGIVSWVAQQEDFVINHISFSWRMLILFYILICTSVMLFKKYKKQKLYWVGIPLSLLFVILTFEKNMAASHEELIIFQNRGNTVLGVLENQKLQLYGKEHIENNTRHFLFDNYLIQKQATIDTSLKTLKNVYQYKQQTLLVIDSTGIYNIKEIKPMIILLSNSPKIHFDRMLDSLTPWKIIADGSNYRSYLDQWEISCKKHNIPFHRTDKKGAFILK